MRRLLRRWPACTVLRQLSYALGALVPVARVVQSQVSASVDGGAAEVSYQGYLRAAVTTLAPSIGYLTRHASVDARGLVSLYQTGDLSADGQVRASAFTSLMQNLLGELYTTVGATQYRTMPSAENGRAGARAYVGRGDVGGWVGANAGFSRDLGNTIAVQQGEGGAWIAWPSTRLSASLVPTRVGPVSYVDAQATAQLVLNELTFSATGGTRPVGAGSPSEAGLGSRVAGATWGQFEAAVRVAPWLAVVADVGSSPTDYVRHIPAVHYAGLALRVTMLGAPTAPIARDILPSAAPGDPPPEVTGAPVVTSVRQNGRLYTLRIRAPRAFAVEVMGDFTGWRPVVAHATGDGTWLLTVALPRGTHRFNVRMDGGAWITPGGITTAADDFGGMNALIVVP